MYDRANWKYGHGRRGKIENARLENTAEIIAKVEMKNESENDDCVKP